MTTENRNQLLPLHVKRLVMVVNAMTIVLVLLTAVFAQQIYELRTQIGGLRTGLERLETELMRIPDARTGRMGSRDNFTDKAVPAKEMGHAHLENRVRSAFE